MSPSRTRRVRRLGAVTSLASAVAVLAASAPAHARTASTSAGSTELRANGAAGIDLDRGSGVVTGVTTAHGALALQSAGGGLYLRDPVTGESQPVRGPVTGHGSELHERATVPSMSAEVDVTYRASRDDTVDVSGTVKDLTGTDRVLDTVFELPLGMTSGDWETDLVDPAPFTAATTTLAPQTSLPLAVVSDSDAGQAIGYAIEPSHASDFELGLTPSASGATFSARQKWGLSPSASGPLHSKAPFGVTLDLGVDPRWGYRSALQRYYDRSPSLFTNPAGKAPCARKRTAGASDPRAYGTWTYTPRSLHADPSGLAFHMSGAQKDGATTLAQLAANEGWSADQRHCISTLPYTIPGQDEITDLPTLPTDYDSAMAAFAGWQHAPMVFGSQNGPASYRSSRQEKTLIENSGLYTPDGKYVADIRNTGWGGNSVTFPTDPNPRLDADNHRLTVAKYMLDYYVPWMLSDPRVDGIFSDSLYTWGKYFDYRKDHFPAARIPLTYQDVSNQYGTAFVPGLSNDLSTLEYLRVLRAKLHARGKILMTNGMKDVNGDSRAFDGFESDVIGDELTLPSLLDNDATFTSLRATADDKPVEDSTYQDWNGVDTWNDEANVSALWNKSLLYGVAPSSGGASLEALEMPQPITKEEAYESPLEISYERRYVPVLRQLMSAGWHAVTGVQASDPKVRIERYGQGSDVYFVILNEDTTQNVSFSVDRTIVPGINRLRATDVLAGRPAAADLRAAVTGHGSVSIPAQGIEVLHFHP